MTTTITAICRRQQIATQFTGGIAIAFLTIAALFLTPTVLRAAPPLPGAIFTTNSGCTGVDLNIYTNKSDVYLNGGPAKPGAASLPDGSYYVQVTDPSGACVLGTSVGLAGAAATPFVVTNGVANCIQLCTVLANASLDPTCAGGGVTDSGCGYNDTPNPGGEYKVWVSNESSFTNNSTKTDNFKVNPPAACVPNPTPCPTPPQCDTKICVNKFYDTNGNGIQDNGEPNITGWEYCVVGNTSFSALRFTFDPPRCLIVAPDTYAVTEGTPIETNWVHTTQTEFDFILAECAAQPVSFGNFCLGPGGGLTLGFWSNKNGQNLTNAADVTFLAGLCLRNANGSDFNPTLKTQLPPWLLGATATNMAYMLSAQLTAMELNVRHNFVNGTATVYEPCLKNYGYPTGIISITDLMTLANNLLCADGYTPSGNPDRAKQECVKNALDDANNNRNFVQAPNTCPATFNTTDTCPFTTPN